MFKIFLLQRLTLIFYLAKLAILLKSPSNAFNYLRAKSSFSHLEVRLKNLAFEARKSDWLAIREIIIDNEYHFINNIIDPKKSYRILDLGANIGLFAIKAFSICNSSSIYSVEASSDTHRVLKANVEKNVGYKWTALHGAVWNFNGSLVLQKSNNPLGHRVGKDGCGETVPAYTLDRLGELFKQRKFEIIKMDIEGAEQEVVMSENSLLKKADHVIIEIHNDRIDEQPIIDRLATIFPKAIKVKQRKSTKPIYIFSAYSF